MPKTLKDMKVVFMGTPEFSVPILEKLNELTDVVLVVSQPDKEVGRKRILTPSPVKSKALELGLEVYTPNKIREEYEYILNQHPDVIITAAYGQIVPKQMIDYPSYGCINVHGSILPKYRGASPIQSAIMNGDETTGITLMYMEEQMDTGAIIQAKEIPIDPEDTYGTLNDKLSLLAVSILEKELPKILEGENFDIPQRDDEATYCKKISREEERLDFNDTAKHLHDKVRALNPSPLANIIINGEEWKVLETKIGDTSKGEVGLISEVNKDSFGINTADNVLLVTKVKRPGKNEMLVKDLFNGYNKDSLLNTKVGE